MRGEQQHHQAQAIERRAVKLSRQSALIGNERDELETVAGPRSKPKTGEQRRDERQRRGASSAVSPRRRAEQDRERGEERAEDDEKSSISGKRVK